MSGYNTRGKQASKLNLLADDSQLVHGIRLLQSITLRTLFNAMLQIVVEKRTRRAAQPCDLVDDLNGRMDRNGRRFRH
jgi:hypothetical protein